MKLIISCGEGDNRIILSSVKLSDEEKARMISVLQMGNKLEIQIPSAVPKDWRPE